MQRLKGSVEAELLFFCSVHEGGQLFTWGQNAHGQLGVGSQTALIPQPQLVERLKGLSLAQIAAGGAHSVVVSLSGAVYSWGKNDFGQLGLGDTEGKERRQFESKAVGRYFPGQQAYCRHRSGSGLSSSFGAAVDGKVF